MKKLTLQLVTLVSALFLLVKDTKAQSFTTNASSPWIGYMNWFDVSTNNYIGGGFWGVPALKTTLNSSSNTLTFQPNFNTYADAVSSGDAGAIAFWTNGAGGGNKIMEALTFREPAGVSGQTVTFMGSVNSNTISSGYTATVFIKILDPNIGYAQTAIVSAPIGAVGSTFSISLAIPAAPANLITQYGVSIRGINANPANEAALGSIVLGPLFPLEVSLEKFNARFNKNQVELVWNTSNEANLKGFEVEKSLDGKLFEKLANVGAKNNSKNEYVLYDNNYLQTCYYRLKMIDEDGKFTLSQVAKVEGEVRNDIRIFPNPAINSLNVSVQDLNQVTEVTFYNIYGQSIKTSTIDKNTNMLDITNLIPGTYLLKFNNGETLKFNKK